ncbi:hypothetical protein HKX48_009564 [Thoreauomyces humboldtii]|nr:hypothetical protein HKX48_009564 [Thoreauomyces humboldtii]
MPSATTTDEPGDSLPVQSQSSESTLRAAVEQINLGNVNSEKFDLSLQTINLALEGRNANEIAAFQSTHNVAPGIFLGLLPYVSEDEDSVRTVSRIVEKLLAPLSFADVRDGYGMVILEGLGHPSGHVRNLAIEALEKAPREDGGLEALSDFLVPLLECLNFPDVAVAQRVEALTCKIARSQQGLDLLLGADGVSVLAGLAESSEVVRFRVYQLAIRVSEVSPMARTACQKSELLRALGDELYDNTDVLARLNVVQVFTTLAETDAGFSFLEDMEVVAQLAALLRTPADDIDDVLLAGAVIKFFGQIAATRPSDFIASCRKHNLLGLLHIQLTGDRPDLREAVVIAIGNIGATPAGLALLDAEKTLLASFLDLARPSTGDLKVAIMQSASCLIGVVHTSEYPGLSDVSHRVFVETAGPTGSVQNLLRYAKGAFLEPRIAACAMLKASAMHAWGLHEVNVNYDLVVFLMDRMSESDAIVKEWKFSIVQQYLAHPQSATLLEENILTRFRNYVREGPFHREIAPVVAFASG